jgi:hypothetical protein
MNVGSGRSISKPEQLYELTAEGRYNSRLVGKQELIIDPAQEWQCETEHPFLPSYSARNNRSFDWFVIGEKENRPPLQNTIVRN